MAKPTVIRHVRPYVMGRTGEICPDGDKGITMLFTIDQENETLDVQWSICVGDTFNKKTGIQEAKKRTPFTIKYERSMSLVDNLFLYFAKAVAAGEKLPHDHRILGGRLWSLM